MVGRNDMADLGQFHTSLFKLREEELPVLLVACVDQNILFLIALQF